MSPATANAPSPSDPTAAPKPAAADMKQQQPADGGLASAPLQPAAPASVWKVPGQSASADKPSAAAPVDLNSWPDPATAASEAAQPSARGAVPAAPKKAGRKGKDKWLPLEAEIQYSKPRSATQTPSAAPRQQRQSQQNGGRQAAPAGDAAARGPRPANAGKKQPPGDEAQEPSSNSNENSTSASRSHSRDAQPAAGQAPAARPARGQSQSQGQSQVQSQSQGATRGRGRGRSRAYGPTAGPQRSGFRAAGHAPSHYHGKGNVQVGGFAPAPLPEPTADDADSIKGFVRAQVEYYFSVENLCKDIFFRTQMDPDGFVPLTLVAGFNRLRSVTTDLGLIADALVASVQVELDDSRERVRKRDSWAVWLFPNQDVVQQQQELDQQEQSQKQQQQQQQEPDQQPAAAQKSE
ncbi:hypothetical protein H4R19_003437 [Coemansia spiralis]|nr:hypothetical protein H4R19_003437 [Coemansia spiralis]